MEYNISSVLFFLCSRFRGENKILAPEVDGWIDLIKTQIQI
jgi:hypothetical protein